MEEQGKDYLKAGERIRKQVNYFGGSMHTENINSGNGTQNINIDRHDINGNNNTMNDNHITNQGNTTNDAESKKDEIVSYVEEVISDMKSYLNDALQDERDYYELLVEMLESEIDKFKSETVDINTSNSLASKFKKLQDKGGAFVKRNWDKIIAIPSLIEEFTKLI